MSTFFKKIYPFCKKIRRFKAGFFLFFNACKDVALRYTGAEKRAFLVKVVKERAKRYNRDYRKKRDKQEQVVRVADLSRFPHIVECAGFVVRKALHNRATVNRF